MQSGVAVRRFASVKRSPKWVNRSRSGLVLGLDDSVPSEGQAHHDMCPKGHPAHLEGRDPWLAIAQFGA